MFLYEIEMSYVEANALNHIRSRLERRHEVETNTPNALREALTSTLDAMVARKKLETIDIASIRQHGEHIHYYFANGDRVEAHVRVTPLPAHLYTVPQVYDKPDN